MSEAMQKIWEGLRKFIIEPVQIYEVLTNSDTIGRTPSLERIGLPTAVFPRK